MRISKTGGRNRAMFIAFLKGVPDEELAFRYQLTLKRVRAILLSEKLKRELSPAPAYHALRTATGFGVRFGVLPN
jgi:hypothetical protein